MPLRALFQQFVQILVYILVKKKGRQVKSFVNIVVYALKIGQQKRQQFEQFEYEAFLNGCFSQFLWLWQQLQEYKQIHEGVGHFLIF